MGFDSLLPAPVSTDNSVAAVNFSNSLLDDTSKKIRKPYTITKSRQNWTDIEHDKFLEALHLFDRDWKKIEAFVGSKTAIQIRSHAQKYFLKVQKSGTKEHVPPPRPKRKATHPYPHKAPKDDDVRSSGAAISHNCCSNSSIDSGPGIWPAGETNNQQEVKQRAAGRVMPDFPKVYRFIGGIFDPNESNHWQKLKTMDPVDVETVVLLMKNLCANLKSPQFEDYRRLFCSYDAGSGKVVSSGSLSLSGCGCGSAIQSS